MTRAKIVAAAAVAAIVVTVVLLAGHDNSYEKAVADGKAKTTKVTPTPVPQTPQEATDRADEINQYCGAQVQPLAYSADSVPPSMRDQIVEQMRTILRSCVSSEIEAYSGSGHVVANGGIVAVAKP